MRAQLRADHVTVAARGVATFEVEVFNPATVIDGITVQVVGLDPGWVRASPERLALFPDAGGTIRLDITVPEELAAGDLPLTIVVHSQVDPTGSIRLPATLAIAPATSTTLTVHPLGIRGRREVTATVVVENQGNHPVEVALSGEENERLVAVTVDPPLITVGPGERVVADVHLRGPRHILGSPIMRPYTVRGVAGDREMVANGTYNQEAFLPRGVATAAILLAIIALWAVVAVVAIRTVLGEDEFSKAAPASFRDPAAALAAIATSATKGLDVRTAGGSLSGQVVAETDGRGIPRMTVEARRSSADGTVVASATATDEDGAFTVVGLLPGTYTLRFSAPGYDDVWYPGVPSEAQATTLAVTSLTEAEPVQVEVRGQPGTLTGRVDVGEGRGQTPVSLTLRPVMGGVRGNPVTAGVAGPDGTYSVGPLPTPADYEITFDASGFQPQSVLVELGGGQQKTVNTVQMTTGLGALAGTITDGRAPLGGVTVTATSGGESYVTATPTSGAVGAFLLADLPTPGTYLLTFELDGYSTETMAVDLGPGEANRELAVVLTGGTGTISGLVTVEGGGGLGDVAVTVTGTGGVEVSTASVTAGAVGSWQVTGLPTPGRYAVTFARDGYLSVTRAVTLSETGSASGIDVRMSRSLGDLAGTIRGPDGNGVAGAEVRVTDGQVIRSTRSAGSPSGEYQILDLPPGSYAVTVTVTAPGLAPATVMIRVEPGQRARADVTLAAP